MVSKNIRMFRLARKLTQKQLANMIMVQDYTIGDWERGRSEPSLEDLRKLCVVFDISADELLDIETPMERQKVIINKENQ